MQGYHDTPHSVKGYWIYPERGPERGCVTRSIPTTQRTSPLNAAFLVEEFYRENKDLNKPVYIAFLDAKSAFDVVVREILMRKVYLYGINPASWQLMDD